MGVLGVVIIIWAVEVGRHRADEIRAVLLPVGVAHFDSGDFGDGVPLVGRLQRPGEQVLLFQRLRCEFWIYAGAAKEKEFFDSSLVSAVNEVFLDAQVFVEELRRVGVVGDDAANFGGGNVNV